jgi:hypothetical protein
MGEDSPSHRHDHNVALASSRSSIASTSSSSS